MHCLSAILSIYEMVSQQLWTMAYMYISGNEVSSLMDSLTTSCDPLEPFPPIWNRYSRGCVTDHDNISSLRPILGARAINYPYSSLGNKMTHCDINEGNARMLEGSSHRVHIPLFGLRLLPSPIMFDPSMSVTPCRGRSIYTTILLGFRLHVYKPPIPV